MTQSAFDSDPSLEWQYSAVRQLLAEPPRKASNLLVATLLLFAVLQLVRNSLSSALMLVGVIAFHELGHYVGMRLFGYRDVKMFFIPMVGAAVSGKRQHVATWKEGIVLLLGPMPGIAVALVLALSPFAASPWGHTLILNLAAINGLNLLPLGFLDGGRLWQCVLTSRSRTLDMVFSLLTTLLLGWLAWTIQAKILAVVAFGVVISSLMSARQRWHIAGIASELRSTEPATPEALEQDSPYSRTVFLSARRMLNAAQQERVPVIAKTMGAIQSASRPAPTFGKSFLLVAAWIIGLLAALIALVVAFGRNDPKPHVQALPETGLTVVFPGRPARFKPADVGSQILGSEGYKYWGFSRAADVSTFRLVDSHSVSNEWIADVLLHNVRSYKKAQFDVPFPVPTRAGMAGTEIKAVIDSNQCRIRVYLSADKAVQLVACASKPDPMLNEFLESLR